MSGIGHQNGHQIFHSRTIWRNGGTNPPATRLDAAEDYRESDGQAGPLPPLTPLRMSQNPGAFSCRKGARPRLTGERSAAIPVNCCLSCRRHEPRNDLAPACDFHFFSAFDPTQKPRAMTSQVTYGGSFHARQ